MAGHTRTPSVLGALNRVRWYFRWPIKWALFGLAYAAVCFPYPRLLIRHLQHWQNPNLLIEPTNPAVMEMANEVKAAMPAGTPPHEVLSHVQKQVLQRIKYEWDWKTWGMADYLPTVDEAIGMGKEDCDGRAVVAASVLKNLGYDARIVTDFGHVWVSTPQGETMGPGKTKTVEVTLEGRKYNLRGLFRIPQILAYGVAVFPLARELILLAVLWVLLLGRTGLLRAGAGLVIFVGALLLLRHGALDYRAPKTWLELAALATFGFGIAVITVRKNPLRTRGATWIETVSARAPV